MKQSARTLCIAMVFCGAFTACRERRPGPTSASAETAAVMREGQSKVSVKYVGLIAHVATDAEHYPHRSVVLADADHKVFLNFPETLDLPQLEKATKCKRDTSAQCKVSEPIGGRIEVGPIKGFSVRVVGYDKTTSTVQSAVEPALDKNAKSFKDFVPSLKTASGGTLTELKKSLKEVAPASDSKEWAMFVPLEGGTLTAEQSCKESKFKDSFAGSNKRYFAKSVIQTGYVTGSPAVQFRSASDNDWQTVTFTSAPTGTTMQVLAQPRAKLHQSHFHLYRRVGNATKFTDIVYVDCEGSNLDPSCTNSQWP